ncbi:hypothetical protein L1I30_03750 [Gillisia sp. M10.2A]|uniref:Secreted protein n=1 Tax=Gillisia lutea TaxID=2909668 RepID=A0ABS9EH52_9FLAO|nr:hypothetical protein [Gillisia lutea]MCF4100773.1 hypothetical protein [Gillisia lutea]
MKTIILKIAFLSLCISTLIGCKEDKKEAANSQPEVETQATNPKTTATVNPAHGEPGHRCDIPVGASLNQPVKTQQKNPSVSPVWAETPSPSINPAHGQPGHDCSKPVGAKL